MRKSIVFYLNGVRTEVGDKRAGMMMADYLRRDAGLCGTKIVCAEGDCGACSILRYVPSGKKGGPSYLAVNSCIATVAQMDGCSVLTVESLATDNQTPSSVQEAMVRCHGTQCGYCTPGFVTTLTGAIEKKISEDPKATRLSERDACNALTGNLCRCTGYKSIIDAAMSIDLKACAKELSPIRHTHTHEIDRALTNIRSEAVHVCSQDFEFFAPVTLSSAAAFLRKNPAARIVGAGTDLGVFHNKGKIQLNQLLSLHLIPELRVVRKLRDRIEVGATATLSELRELLKSTIPDLAHYLDIFASPQIKNVATLAGNLAGASPIGDLLPPLLVLDAEIHTYSARPSKKPRSRKISIHQFFVDYRKTALEKGELITKISFQIPKKQQHFTCYKVSERKDLDISTVNAAFLAETETHQGKRTVSEASLAMGGVAAVPLRLTNTENFLRGKELNAVLVKEAAYKLKEDIRPLSDVRGSRAFRGVIAENLLSRFLRESFLAQTGGET